MTATRWPTSRPPRCDPSTRAAGRSDATQRALLQKLGELQKELQALRDEKDKLEEVGAEREKGTASRRTFEESVFEALDDIALSQGDVAEAVGDRREATGKVGDVVVAIDGCNGPARGRVVIEAKDRKLSSRARWASRWRWPSVQPTGRAGGAHRRKRCRPGSSRCASTTATARGGPRSPVGNAGAGERLPPRPRPGADEALRRRRD